MEGKYKRLPLNWPLLHEALDFSSTSDQTIIAAPGTGYRIRLACLDLTALSNVEVAVKSGTTTIRTYQAQVVEKQWYPALNLGEAEALVLTATTATRITGGVSYYIEAV
jgi:hypothetical protein